MKPWTRWEDWANVGLGAWLFISTWVLGYASSTAAAVNAWILGSVIVLLALWGLARPRMRAADGVTVLLGGWAFVSPWALHFASLSSAASWNNWIVGASVFFLATIGIPMTTMRFDRRHG